MQDTDPFTIDRRWRERCRRARLEFLLTELQTARVSASLAMTSTDPANAAQYRDFAWKAHDAVIHFRPTLVLEHHEDERITWELASLECILGQLMESEPEAGVDGEHSAQTHNTNFPAAVKRSRAPR